jgi:hypothetical protein
MLTVKTGFPEKTTEISNLLYKVVLDIYLRIDSHRITTLVEKDTDSISR